jgi:hypothetical protein
LTKHTFSVALRPLPRTVTKDGGRRPHDERVPSSSPDESPAGPAAFRPMLPCGWIGAIKEFPVAAAIVPYAAAPGARRAGKQASALSPVRRKFGWGNFKPLSWQWKWAVPWPGRIRPDLSPAQPSSPRKSEFCGFVSFLSSSSWWSSREGEGVVLGNQATSHDGATARRWGGIERWNECYVGSGPWVLSLLTLLPTKREGERGPEG